MTNGVLLLGRILMSALVIFAGAAKLVSAAATQERFARMELPLLAWLIIVVIEVGGVRALLLGTPPPPPVVWLSGRLRLCRRLQRRLAQAPQRVIA